MVPENSADQSGGQDWVSQCQSASKRPPSAEMERHPATDNNAPHFLDMMVRAPRAVNLVAKSGGR